MLPEITAVMITGKSDKRRSLATRSLRSFVEQTYPNKRLIVVNTGDKPFLVGDGGQMFEMHMPGSRAKLGTLRNAALSRLAEDAWWIQWDDDDWHHPMRMWYQASAIPMRGKNDIAILLDGQVRYSFLENAAFAYRWTLQVCPGIPGTILCKNKIGRTYPANAKGEDVEFLNNYQPSQLVVLPNHHQGNSHLYLRFAHGDNTWSQDHIMGAMKDSCGGDIKNKWFLSREQSTYLRQVLHSRYSSELAHHDVEKSAIYFS